MAERGGERAALLRVDAVIAPHEAALMMALIGLVIIWLDPL
jgi:hypothetical protein